MPDRVPTERLGVQPDGPGDAVADDAGACAHGQPNQRHADHWYADDDDGNADHRCAKLGRADDRHADWRKRLLGANVGGLHGGELVLRAGHRHVLQEERALLAVPHGVPGRPRGRRLGVHRGAEQRHADVACADQLGANDGYADHVHSCPDNPVTNH